MAEAGGLRRRERGRRTGEALPPPWSSRRGALRGTGRRVSAAGAPGRRAGAEKGARGAGKGSLEAGTAETPPGGRRSRKSRGRAAAVAAGVPGHRPLRLGFPGPEPPRARAGLSGGA